jgi:hypothetical protein
LYILVKPKQTPATRLEGLEEAIIPVEMATAKYQIKVKSQGGKIMRRIV